MCPSQSYEQPLCLSIRCDRIVGKILSWKISWIEIVLKESWKIRGGSGKESPSQPSSGVRRIYFGGGQLQTKMMKSPFRGLWLSIMAKKSWGVIVPLASPLGTPLQPNVLEVLERMERWKTLPSRHLVSRNLRTQICQTQNQRVLSSDFNSQQRNSRTSLRIANSPRELPASSPRNRSTAQKKKYFRIYGNAAIGANDKRKTTDVVQWTTEQTFTKSRTISRR